MNISKFISSLVFGLALAGGSLLVASCDSGGGDNGPDGNSTVQGTVVSFSSGTAYFVPMHAPRGLAGVLAGLLDLVIPQAQAGQNNVSVRIAGTGLFATTDETGFFVISGVPAGSQSLEFSMGTKSVSYAVGVPANATVTIKNISISGNSITTGGVDTQIHVAPINTVESPTSTNAVPTTNSVTVI